MNTYVNQAYVPSIHDFGDDYHLPDVEIESESISMARVKKIRRKYQNWFDYIEAVDLYDEYVTALKDKYGGDAGFRIAKLLGKVREYIPNYPQLRKTRRNRYYRKNRIPKIEREEVEFEKTPIEELNNLPDSKVSVKLRGAKKVDGLYAGGGASASSIAQITEEMEILQVYWMRHKQRIDSLKASGKKKRRLKRDLNRKTLRMSLQYRSISDILAMDEKRRRDKFFDTGEKTQNSIYYKGTYVSSAEQEQLDLVARLSNLGVVFSKLTRANTKLIHKKITRNLNKKSKSERKREKRMKKLRKKEDKYVRKFSHDQFRDWGELEDEMINMTGTRTFDKY